ncbi:MAG: tetratricopeptide repeat protein [Caldimicrobium sp.]
MKKSLSLMAIIVGLLMGCMTNEEMKSLKIKLINLETVTQSQEEKIKQLEKNMAELEKRIDANISQKFMQVQSKLLVDLEDLRKEVVALQGRVDELTFQQEGERKTQLKAIEDLRTRLETMEVKIKEMEDKIKEVENKVLEKLSKESSTTHEEMTKNEKKDDLKEEELYHKAYSLFSKGDIKGARSLWEEYLKRFPKGKWVGQTFFYIGETYFKEKDYEAAILSYQKLIDLPEPNPLKPKAMLRQADAFLNLKDKKAAKILYRRIQQMFPGTPEAKEAANKLKELK